MHALLLLLNSLRFSKNLDVLKYVLYILCKHIISRKRQRDIDIYVYIHICFRFFIYKINYDYTDIIITCETFC